MAHWPDQDVIAEADLATHAADTTAVHGITNTALLVEDADLAAAVAALEAEINTGGSGLAAHIADTTDVHGIADTLKLALLSDPRLLGHTGRVRGYGSSLIIADGGHTNVTSDRWFSKIKKSVAADIEMNYGVGGSKLLVNQNTSGWAQIWQHQGDRLPTSSAGTLSVLDIRPPAGLIGLQHGINDYGVYGSQGASFYNAFQKTLEAVVRMLRGGYVWRTSSSRWSNTAGWSNASSSAYGGAYFSRASNGSLIFTSPLNFPGGTMTFYLAVRPDANEASRVQVSIDGGATVVTVDTNGVGITGQWVVVPIVVPNVPAGTGHTVTLTFDTIAAGGTGRFLGGTLASEWPPMILLVGQPYTPTMPPTSEPQMTTAVVDAGNAAHAAVAGMFSDGKVIYVDLTSMNGDASYWQDDVHYNPKGHARIAVRCAIELAKAGGIPDGFSAGPTLDFAGPIDWSAPPGQVVLDTSTGRLTFQKSITTGDVGSVQNWDSDLDLIAAQANSSFGLSLLTRADAAALRTLAGLVIGTDVEAHDPDLTDFAALAPANDDVAQRKAGHWVNRSIPQLVADLGPVKYIFDTHANRIAAAHAVGRMWKETDTNLIYYDDGAAWQIWKGDGVVRKTADETVNNSAVLQNDDHLLFPVEANEVWWAEAFLLVQGLSGTPDFNMGWTGPAGATSYHALEQSANSAWSEVGTGGTPVAMKTIGQALSVGTGNSIFGLAFRGHFFVGSTAGNIRLQWAQATATVEDLKVLANSFMRIRRLA